MAALRAFVQLTAIGYVIKLIFDSAHVAFAFVLIAVMVVFGALTARRRASKVPDAFWPLLIALGVGGAWRRWAWSSALGVFEPSRATWSRWAAW